MADPAYAIPSPDLPALTVRWEGLVVAIDATTLNTIARKATHYLLPLALMTTLGRASGQSVPRQSALAQLLSLNLADIRRANPALRTYTAPGQMHTILRRPEFYTLAVDGVEVRDWVAGLFDRDRMSDVGQSLLADSAR